MPSRYLKLGVAKNTDRDTSLFQPVPDRPPRIPSWPSLRRSQSSREALESPRTSVTYDRDSRAEQEKQQARRKMGEKIEEHSRRKMEEHQDRRKVQEQEARRKDEQHREPALDLEQRPGNESPELRRAKSSTIHRQEHHGFFVFQPKICLPRAQSMRYNRIVSAAEESLDGPIHPPRRSCVDTFRMEGKNQHLVRVSGSYQTHDGEILSIECARCGRWLGSIAQRVELDEGSITLCRICNPQGAAAAMDAGDSKVAAAQNRRGGGILRGLRRMLGLSKKKPIESRTNRR